MTSPPVRLGHRLTSPGHVGEPAVQRRGVAPRVAAEAAGPRPRRRAAGRAAPGWWWTCRRRWGRGSRAPRPARTVRSSPSRARVLPKSLTSPEISIGCATPVTLAPRRSRAGEVRGAGDQALTTSTRTDCASATAASSTARRGSGTGSHGSTRAEDPQPRVGEHLVDRGVVAPGHQRAASGRRGSAPRGRPRPRRPAAPGCRVAGRTAAGSARRPWCGPGRAAGRPWTRRSAPPPAGRPRTRPCAPAARPSRPAAAPPPRSAAASGRPAYALLEGQPRGEGRAVGRGPAQRPVDHGQGGRAVPAVEVEHPALQASGGDEDDGHGPTLPAGQRQVRAARRRLAGSRLRR